MRREETACLFLSSFLLNSKSKVCGFLTPRLRARSDGSRRCYARDQLEPHLVRSSCDELLFGGCLFTGLVYFLLALSEGGQEELRVVVEVLGEGIHAHQELVQVDIQGVLG